MALDSRSDQMLSHYRLVEKIGEGGMGVVWKADDMVLGRTVAIKVLPGDLALDEERRKMFLDEARLAASVSHGNIVQVHELGREGDLDFIVMEYVEGKPLNAILRGRPLPADKVVELGLQIAQGLVRAHRKNLIHRDLKPANIIVTPDGEAKIVDFGLATLLSHLDSFIGSSATTLTDRMQEQRGSPIVGTVPYMSPEQVLGEKLDARSDIFSFGSVLYEMTSGQRPFTGSKAADVATAILSNRPTPVHRLARNVPFELNRIIEKALAVKPNDRYQTIDDVAVDLKRLGRELESGSSPSFEDLRGIDRKPRRTSVATALVLVLTVVGVVMIAFWMSGNQPHIAGSGEPGIAFELRPVRMTAYPAGVSPGVGMISPDGRYFASWQRENGLMLFEIDAGKNTEIVGAGRLYGWMPDGRILSYTNDSYWSVSPLDSTKERILPWMSGRLLTISSDKTTVAFTKKDGDIWISDLSGNSRRLLLAGGPGVLLSDLTWNPSGTLLAFRKHDPLAPGSKLKIGIVDPSGQATILIENEPLLHLQGVGSGVPSICWLSDRQILYTRSLAYPDHFSSEFWILELDPSSKEVKLDRRLVGWPGSTLTHPVAASGNRISFMRTEISEDVYLIDLNGKGVDLQPVRLSLDDRPDVPGVWNSDGRELFFASDRNGKKDIFVQGVDSRRAREFVATQSPEWPASLSPGGDMLLFWRLTDSRGRELLKIPVNGGYAEVVMRFDDWADIRCPESPEQPCVLCQRSAGSVTCSIVSPGFELGEEIADFKEARRTWSWDLSKDGGTIAALVGDRKIRTVNVESGSSRDIDIAVSGYKFQYITWSPDGRSIYLTGMGYVIGKASLDGTFELIWRSDTSWPYSPCVSVDGRYLAVGIRAYDADFWMIEGFD